MAKNTFPQSAVFSTNEFFGRSARHGAVLLVGLALAFTPSSVAFGQSSQLEQQQQEQQRQQEEQQRQQQEQQRQQQEHDQQQRDEQARQQQEQQRQQQEQQQRDQQQRDEQARQQEQQQQQQEQQQRDQQQRDEQARQQQEQQRQQQEQQRQQLVDQQQREQQLRAPQQPEHTSSDSAVPISNANSEASRPTAQPSASDVKRKIKMPPVERKPDPTAPLNATVKENEPTIPEPDLRRKICDNGPCKEPEPKPIAPPTLGKICKDGPCQSCPTGQSPGKDGHCAATAPLANAKAVDQQACPAGQTWNGNQCAVVGAQPTGIGSPANCAGTTASLQNVIGRLRIAREQWDVCRQNTQGQECQQEKAKYGAVFGEYQGLLGGVPAQCRIGLPDPSAIF
jgi:chemotaxis protein histidine kinase CheA